MAAIYPIPTTRSSEALVQSRLLAQLQVDQLDLVRLQTQISTGRRVLAPSEDASAAIRAVGLQRLLEQKAQAQTNLTTNQSYLSASDVAISALSGLITSIRGTAISVVDTTSSDTERGAAAVEIERAISQILDVANQQFRGRYLFAGSQTTVRPYSAAGDFIQYSGNEGLLRSFADLDLLTQSNVPGSKLFGGLSAEQKGTVDLNPVLTAETRLATLHGGKGITRGSLAISDGVSTRIIDISAAETIGDVARLIERNPPTGRRVTARVTSTGLDIDIDDSGGGNLSIREVGSGTTASELGVLNAAGVGTGTIVGRDLQPRLELTSRLENILGTRATAIVSSPNLNNDIVLQARGHGAAYNGIRVQFVDDELLTAAPGLSAGAEVAAYSETPVAAQASVTWFDGPAGENDIVITAAQGGAQFNNVQIVLAKQAGLGAANPTAVYSDNGTARTLTITIDNAVDTPIAAIKAAINGIQIAGQPAFIATDDDSASGGDGSGSVSFLTPTGPLGNTGHSGADARTISVRVQNGSSTAEQVVQALQGNPAISALFDVSADVKDASSPSVNGLGAVDVNATAVTAGGSGVDFDKTSGLQIVNGGKTHTIQFQDATTIEDLLNTLNGSGAGVLAQINASGTGIDIRSRLSGTDLSIGENGGLTATQLGVRTLTEETRLADLRHGLGVHDVEGVDFTVRRNDGVELAIDIHSAKSIGDVLDLINNHPDNLTPGVRVVAQLTATGNGIELVDDNPQGTGQLTLLRAFNSEAAWDLGLIPRGQDTALASDGPPPVAASATVRLAPPNAANTGLVLTANSIGTAFNNVQIVFQNVAAVGNQALVAYDAVTKTLAIDVDPSATTAATVRDAINAHGLFHAELETTFDPTNSGAGLMAQAGTLGVTAGGSSNPASLPATGAVAFASPNHLNTALAFTANNPGTLYNGATIELIDDQTGDVALADWDLGSRRLRIRIDATATTANTILNAVNQQGLFTAALDRSTDATNDGSGIVGSTGVVSTMAGGTPEVLTGRDPYAIEASGIFNTLSRLQRALETNDLIEIQRTVAQLDKDLEQVNFVRADLGAKSQSLDTLKFRLEDETVELTSTLSQEIDVDLVEAISNLTARQASYQASLQLMGRTFQLSLLDYI